MNKKTIKNGVFSNRIVIYGKHPFFAILKSNKRKIYNIYISNKNKKEFYDIIKKDNIDIANKNISFVENLELDKIFNNKEKNHQGYLMFVAEKQKISFDTFINSFH